MLIKKGTAKMMKNRSKTSNLQIKELKTILDLQCGGSSRNSFETSKMLVLDKRNTNPSMQSTIKAFHLTEQDHHFPCRKV